MLDNELVISELVPAAVALPSLQYAAMPYCGKLPEIAWADGKLVLSAGCDSAAEGVLFVEGFFPGAAALIERAPYDGNLRLRVRAGGLQDRYRWPRL